MLSDEILMVQFQAGSRESFDELFARYQQSLYGFYRRRLADRYYAADLAQEAWMAVLRGAGCYQPRAPFRTYLYGIAFKLLAGERRNNRRRQAALEPPPVPERDVPEYEYWVPAALQKLPPTEREILMLREYEQLSYAEIAALLRIPLNTVRSRLFRARLTLRRFLDPGTEAISSEGTV